jgi:hypothetical protein
MRCRSYSSIAGIGKERKVIIRGWAERGMAVEGRSGSNTSRKKIIEGKRGRKRVESG